MLVSDRALGRDRIASGIQNQRFLDQVSALSLPAMYVLGCWVADVFKFLVSGIL